MSRYRSRSRSRRLSRLRAMLLLPALLAGAGAAGAQEVKSATGVICNTEAQVARVIAAGPKAAEAAISAINGEESRSCGIVPVVYVERTQRDTVRNAHGAFRVVEIIVIGVALAEGVQPVPPLAQFTFVKVHEIAV